MRLFEVRGDVVLAGFKLATNRSSHVALGDDEWSGRPPVVLQCDSGLIETESAGAQDDDQADQNDDGGNRVVQASRQAAYRCIKRATIFSRRVQDGVEDPDLWFLKASAAAAEHDCLLLWRWRSYRFGRAMVVVTPQVRIYARRDYEYSIGREPNYSIIEILVGLAPGQSLRGLRTGQANKSPYPPSEQYCELQWDGHDLLVETARQNLTT